MRQNRNAFMVMPFSNSVSKSVYDNCIKPVFDEFDLSIRRADDVFGTQPIYDDIVREIQSASIIIVDITDNNPNVFYELGVAHTLKKDQTIIITNQNFSSTPFDIAHFRIIKYQDSMQGSVEFKTAFRNTLKIVLNDKATLHKDEFNLIYNLYKSNDKLSQLTLLPAIKFYESIVKLEDKLQIEWKNDTENDGMFATIIDRKLIGAYIDFGYLKVNNRILSISATGEAFVRFIAAKGFLIEMVNQQKRTKEYIPWMDRNIN